MFIFEIRSYGIHMQTKPKFQPRYLCENYKFSVKNDIFRVGYENFHRDFESIFFKSKDLPNES